MGDKIYALTGDHLIFSKVKNGSKEIEEKEINSVIDEIRGDSSTVGTEELYNALLEKYDVEDAEDLLDTINQVASFEGSSETISKKDFNKIYEVDRIKDTTDAQSTSSTTNDTVSSGNVAANTSVLGTSNVSETTTAADTSSVNETGFTTEALYKMNGEQFCSAMDSEVKNQLIDYFESQVDVIQESLDDTKEHNGIISGLWDGFKNLTGIGASSNKAQDKIDNLKSQIDNAENDPSQLASVYKNITGKELTAEEYEKICSGESTLVNDTEAAQSVSKYSDGQRMATDVIADVAVGFASAAAIAAAPFTGGASLALGAAVGVVVKPAIKFTDAKTGGREYNLQDAGYDAVTGGVGGAMSFAGAKIGGAVSTGIAKVSGLPMLEKVVSTKVGGAAFNFAAKSASRYTIGFTAGAADAVARDVMTGNTDNVLGDALKQGNAAGLTSVVIGGATDAIGAGVNKIKGTNASGTNVSGTDASGTKAGALADDIKGLPDKNLDIDGAQNSLAEVLDADGNVITTYDAKFSEIDVNAPKVDVDVNAPKIDVDAPKVQTYTADDLAAAQSKVNDLYSEVLKYNGEELPESLQKEFSQAYDELNNIKKSMNPPADVPKPTATDALEPKADKPVSETAPKRSAAEIEKDITSTEAQLKEAQKNVKRNQGKSKEAQAKGEKTVESLQRKLDGLKAEKAGIQAEVPEVKVSNTPEVNSAETINFKNGILEVEGSTVNIEEAFDAGYFPDKEWELAQKAKKINIEVDNAQVQINIEKGTIKLGNKEALLSKTDDIVSLMGDTLKTEAGIKEYKQMANLAYNLGIIDYETCLRIKEPALTAWKTSIAKDVGNITKMNNI